MLLTNLPAKIVHEPVNQLTLFQEDSASSGIPVLKSELEEFEKTFVKLIIANTLKVGMYPLADFNKLQELAGLGCCGG